MASIIETMNTTDLSSNELSSLSREDLVKLVTRAQMEMEFYKAKAGQLYTNTRPRKNIICIKSRFSTV